MTDTARQQPAQSFLLFPQLPVELRRLIWELCLPARVVELNLQVQRTHIAHTSCSLQRTSLINTRAPLATRVCKESRNVALLAGATELYNDAYADDVTHNIQYFWVTPPTDVLHLNCCSPYDVWYNRSGNPLRSLVWLARRNQHYTRMSIVAPLVMGFDEHEGAAFSAEFLEDFEVLAEGGGPYMTTLCVVSLHVGLDAALQTEGGMLFGRLGEERVKLIEAGDRAALQAYCNLWTAGPAQDREPAPYFDLVVRRHESEWLPLVAQWRRRLVTAWVRHCWAKEEAGTKPANIQDPQRVWRALGKDEWRVAQIGDSGHYLDFMRPGPPWPLFDELAARHAPNKEHPWVAGVLRDMPCFEPVVMFRLCEDKCYTPKPRALEQPRALEPHRAGSRGAGRNRGRTQDWSLHYLTDFLD
ncbi:hypothetical protein V496_00600 [Pseudogymnoascus sp. VKM F-4515 (FW-2607)]|nr:hypothetical protein V496_00600 [Pseudogymnoascus sp. VKM F-4515 (FW-2607)]